MALLNGSSWQKFRHSWERRVILIFGERHASNYFTEKDELLNKARVEVSPLKFAENVGLAANLSKKCKICAQCVECGEKKLSSGEFFLYRSLKR